MPLFRSELEIFLIPSNPSSVLSITDLVGIESTFGSIAEPLLLRLPVKWFERPLLAFGNPSAILCITNLVGLKFTVSSIAEPFFFLLPRIWGERPLLADPPSILGITNLVSLEFTVSGITVPLISILPGRPSNKSLILFGFSVFVLKISLHSATGSAIKPSFFLFV